MRLIDADKLPATCNVAIVNGKVELNGWIAAKRITEAPTVEAIPIEWLKEWFNTKMNRTLLPRNFEMVCSWMIYDWENENERMDNR